MTGPAFKDTHNGGYTVLECLYGHAGLQDSHGKDAHFSLLHVAAQNHLALLNEQRENSDTQSLQHTPQTGSMAPKRI
jgi:hypothetical protein